MLSGNRASGLVPLNGEQCTSIQFIFSSVSFYFGNAQHWVIFLKMDCSFEHTLLGNEQTHIIWRSETDLLKEVMAIFGFLFPLFCPRTTAV